MKTVADFRHMIQAGLFLVLLLSSNIQTEALGKQQCVTCFWNKLETDNVFLEQVVRFLSGKSQDECKLESPDDKDKVTQKICPKPSPGEKVACLIFDGEFTATVFGAELKYNMIQRGCVRIPLGEPYTCQTGLTSDNSLFNFINQGLQNLNLGQVSGKWKLCLNNDGLDNAGTSHHGFGVLVLASTFFVWFMAYF